MAFLRSRKLFSQYVLLFSLLSNFVVADGECYFPGGAWARDYVPCDPYARTASCCPKGYTCYSNHLCVATHPDVINSTSPIGTSLRPGCTNPAWDELNCGDFCLNNPRNDNLGDLAACGDNTFCCGADVRNGNCNCANRAGAFTVPSGSAVTIIGHEGLTYTSTAVLSGGSNPTVRPSSTSDSGSSLTATEQSTTTASTTPPPKPIPVTDTIGFKAGLGAGLGALSLLVLAAAILYCRRPRRGDPNADLALPDPEAWKLAALDGSPDGRSDADGVRLGHYPPPPDDIVPDRQPFDDGAVGAAADRPEAAGQTTTVYPTLNFEAAAPGADPHNPYAPPPLVQGGIARTPSPVDSEAPTQVAWRPSGSEARGAPAGAKEKASSGGLWVMAGGERPGQS